MRLASLSLLAILGGCADPTDDDSDREAEAAPEQPLGKEDASFAGLYATTATSLRSGDIPNLELGAGGEFVRRRCYHASCAVVAAESDHFDSYTSSTGKTYLRFFGVRSEWNAAHDDRNEVSLIADVYEIKTTATTIKLRKSYTSRWLTLRKTTATTLCSAGGGDWDNGSCTCPGTGGWSDDGYVGFVAGLGGCTVIPGAGESECDDTGGWYTDDDATLAGTYCRCDKGNYLTNAGCEPI